MCVSFVRLVCVCVCCVHCVCLYVNVASCSSHFVTRVGHACELVLHCEFGVCVCVGVCHGALHVYKLSGVS